MQVICVLINNQEVIFDFVQACFRYGARLAWTQEAVFLEFPGVQSPYSLEKLFSSLEDLAAHFEVQTRIAAAEDAPTALCFAHYGVMRREQLPLDALKYYFSPFRVPEELKTALTLLRTRGYRTLKDLTKVLPSSLLQEFGNTLMEAWLRARDKSGRSWPGFQFLESFAPSPEEEALGFAHAS